MRFTFMIQQVIMYWRSTVLNQIIDASGIGLVFLTGIIRYAAHNCCNVQLQQRVIEKQSRSR